MMLNGQNVMISRSCIERNINGQMYGFYNLGRKKKLVESKNLTLTNPRGISSVNAL